MSTVTEAGGVDNLTGPEQLAIIYDWARTRSPEAVTEGDYDTIMRQFGLAGSFAQLKGYLSSGGSLSSEQITEVINSQNSMAKSRAQELERINQAHETRARNVGYQPYYIRPLNTDFSRMVTPETNPERYKPLVP